jgi:hypothetical protein
MMISRRLPCLQRLKVCFSLEYQFPKNKVNPGRFFVLVLQGLRRREFAGASPKQASSILFVCQCMTYLNPFLKLKIITTGSCNKKKPAGKPAGCRTQT